MTIREQVIYPLDDTLEGTLEHAQNYINILIEKYGKEAKLEFYYYLNTHGG